MLSEIKGTKLVELPYLDTQMSNPNKNVLIIGERIGNEGIIETIIEKTKTITCTDIMPMKENSILSDIISTTPTVKFLQQDFLSFDESVKFDYIVCINVLEHFGMNFSKKPMFTDTTITDDDIIKWNYDLKAITKMIKLLNEKGSRIIITVPCGNPIFSGDCDEDTTLPFLRRYDYSRIQKIKTLVTNCGCEITDAFYYSENFNDWFEPSIDISHPSNTNMHNAFSPNAMWAFTIQK
jgi:hypothetical protein